MALARNDPSAAVEWPLQKAVALGTRNAAGLLSRPGVASGQDEAALEQAITCFQQAVTIDPHLAEAYYTMAARLSAAVGRLDEAVESFRSAAANMPDAAGDPLHYSPTPCETWAG